MSVTVFGSINYDLVTTAKQLPGPGETIAAENFEPHYGGKGSNQCLAVKRLLPLGSPISVRMVARIGNDLFGKELKESLNKESIDTQYVETVEGVSTGVATILVDSESGENRILVYPGANGTWTKCPEVITQTRMLILQNEIPLSIVYEALSMAKDAGVTTVYNPSPVDAHTALNIYKAVDYLVLNTNEADVLIRNLMGKDSNIDNDVQRALEALTLLNEVLPDTQVIITLSDNGYVYGKGSIGKASKPPGRIVDTTGAGDTFLGALCGQLIQHGDLKKALEFAARAAAIAVTKHGAAESIPYARDII